MNSLYKYFIMLYFVITSACSPIAYKNTIHHQRITRVVQALIVIDSDISEWESSFNRAVNSFYSQTGILIKKAAVIRHKFRCASYNEHTRLLHELYYDEPFDIIIAYVKPCNGWLGYLIPSVAGGIDDVYRRYIVLYSKAYQVLVHELGHAFILSYDHDCCGIMTPILFCLTRDICPWTDMFTKRDLSEIRRNAHRDFKVKIHRK